MAQGKLLHTRYHEKESPLEHATEHPLDNSSKQTHWARTITAACSVRFGPVRFGSFPRPVPAGSAIQRFDSVRFGRLGSVSYSFLITLGGTSGHLGAHRSIKELSLSSSLKNTLSCVFMRIRKLCNSYPCPCPSQFVEQFCIIR